ncbi:MAG: multifunctional oxoglutarate decarboxylase/oxoglutarate dehydrogenase thiamine pyrophosphate-binding subunit/dihydrolipoyllysine-residue succinyltransferase subunit, partial [Actinomycetota bacterium]|nr:multifunctional oxoglutarate decarboxylase/oxoglutarate dehydrogenase thiamine pyrophosphate-binding subunit/dihydrolipoyllysine-residue succinyltransferase subunit [Actinomycetota bacterium]
YKPPRGDGAPRSAARKPEAPAVKEAQTTPPRADGTRPLAPDKSDGAVEESGSELPDGAFPLRGAAARIAANMEASLGIPTATSVRAVPGKLLEENRRIINRYLKDHVAGKISFTHIIGFAILRALEARPAMKVSYTEARGAPYVVQHKHVNFGIAVDVPRDDGSRILYVPNIKDADQLDFSGFWAAYEDMIRKVHGNKLTPEDFAHTTVTLTNPGTVGTRLSVPRLMPSQGLIVGTGAIDYPPEYEASDPRNLARLGVSKVLTITSTYDHRVIQGAESGEFLAHVHRLLLGGDRFYDAIFSSLRIPYEPVRWSRDWSTIGDVDGELDKQARVSRLVNMYRVRGHLLAELNPIAWEVLSHRELDLSYYGLTVWDLEREFLNEDLPGPAKQTLQEIVDRLRDSYCRTVGVEYMHISDPEQKHWIQQRVESPPTELSREDKIHVLDRLNAAEAFERFLHSKYMGHKRFSLEGAESTIPMLDTLLEEAADCGVVEVIMGMSHRGRLNVLANIVGKPLKEIFKEFEGSIDPRSVQGSGDVKYHLGMTGRFKSRDGTEAGVVLASNPSHLEAVDPVVEGMARAKQDVLGPGSRDRVLPVLLHGDAAFAGQGVVAETLNMSALPGYKVGGTIHLVVNNNIGFTTSPAAGRSTTYATDIAKMVQAPILHVNGDDPEACVRVMRLAFAYRRTFNKDIVVDLVCYRRYGHNEGDEPGFTQPLMYAKIDERRSVRKLYTEWLLNRGELSVEEAEDTFQNFSERLQGAFQETREAAPPPDVRAAKPPVPVGVLPHVDTGVPRERLELIHKKLTSFPPGFEPHPKLKKLIEKRATMLERDAIDWSAGEALAFGSMVLQGILVRLSGQDSRRGTFSQRHSVLVDYRSGDEYTPLNDLSDDQAPFRAYDSLLSEFGVVGFEYGYSIGNGEALVCWEAQFGDFVNEAQVIIDQFIVAGEDKWDQQSGLVLLLPHGFEGQGPEHSSGRLERFLTLAAEDSIQVTQPTSPAQYFHVLRRQMARSIRKPLIVMTPKSLLRDPRARSATSDLMEGYFRETLDDASVEQPEDIERILLCTGKVAYDLLEERNKRKAPMAIVRVEQLYPFPHGQLLEIFERYPNAEGVRWVQEEPENMGGWFFVRQWLARRLPERLTLDFAARPESASPASGSARIHEQEEEDILAAAFR